LELLSRVERGESFVEETEGKNAFASHGARGHKELPLFDEAPPAIHLSESETRPILSRLRPEGLPIGGHQLLADVLVDHESAAPTIENPAAEGISAGKNTYTYDAHTYHTKVPPQGIAEVIKQYLPERGLVLDPFAGSGMTGVAALTLGNDVVLNELSPAASFIGDRFTRSFDGAAFDAGVKAVCASLEDIRKKLYTTSCRTCGRDTEILFTVWSYRVCCTACNHEFLLWDHCRKYGASVREHKILSTFSCPQCSRVIHKSQLRRTIAEPVFVGYKCCSSRQEEHPLSQEDWVRLRDIETIPPLAEGFYPTNPLPDGVNLNQPKRQGLNSIDRFYTARNLSAMSQIWRAIHRIENLELSAFLAFAFTSLYQRVTRLSEFRFWGGSGNTAHFNVPYIFNEANVFVTFERKAKTIRDHLATTARFYSGRALVRTGSATDLSFLPDDSVDFIFTDPPFGANINYSEMNFLWESWLNSFTDNTDEAIVNRFQHKEISDYADLMTNSLKECYRVLRTDHWMVLVFMNSSERVWEALRSAILRAGFTLYRADIFDKQHGTFKQYVSDNTAGCDLLLHCRKCSTPVKTISAPSNGARAHSVGSFLASRTGELPKLPFLHVQRQQEIDYRMLYSEFIGEKLLSEARLLDFATFRALASSLIEEAPNRE
jgi:DNA modification methylase